MTATAQMGIEVIESLMARAFSGQANGIGVMQTVKSTIACRTSSDARLIAGHFGVSGWDKKVIASTLTTMIVDAMLLSAEYDNA